MAKSRASGTARTVLVVGCILAVIGLFAAVVRQSWITNGRAAEIVRLESMGAEILHPLTTLLAEMVGAQAAAVRGAPVDADTLRRAIADVAELDRGYGAALRTTQRLADLTSQVEVALTERETGRAAFDTYSGLVTLTVDLIRRVGDTSHLVHDPDLDSYYLMDAAIVRLPDAMVLAGRAADLAELGEGRLEGQDAVRAAVARFGVSDAAEKVNDGLTKSVDFTQRSALSERITERLDAFKSAADGFAPPTIFVELSDTVDTETLAASARRVYAAANPLAHRLLSELQVLLDDRADELAAQWRFTLLAGAGALALSVVVVWIVVRSAPRRRPAVTTPGSARERTPELADAR